MRSLVGRRKNVNVGVSGGSEITARGLRSFETEFSMFAREEARRIKEEEVAC